MQRSLTLNDVTQAHTLLKIFCNGFKNLYGESSCVPNMHLMLHIKDCIFDYGSVYSFWCFSFERFNGILGSYHTNNHSIELQVMFVIKCQLGPSNLQLHSYTCNNELSSWNDILNSRSIQQADRVCGKELEFTVQTPLSKSTKFALENEYRESILELFTVLYSQFNVVRISIFAQSYSRVKMFGEVYTSNSYRAGSTRNCFVLARYSPSAKVYRPAVIKNIIKINCIMEESPTNEISKEQYLIQVSWFKVHPHQNLYGHNSPTKIWDTEFEREISFIPMKFTKKRVVCVKKRIHIQGLNGNAYDDINIIIPIPLKSIL